jgi:hypothetical protein
LRAAAHAWRAARARAAELAAIATAFEPVGLTNTSLALLLIATIAIQVAEWVFAWTSLPMVVGVRQRSFAGVSLATLAVAALLTLEWVFANLGLAHASRYLASRDRAGSHRWTRVLAGVGFVLALLLLLLMNVGLVDQIAALREIGVAVAMSDDVELDRAAVGWAVRVISIVVAIDGGILLLLFEVERRRRSIYRRLRQAGAQALVLEKAAREAFARWLAARTVEANAEEHVTAARAKFMAEAELRIGQALARQAVPEPRTLEERVARMLGHPAA